MENETFLTEEAYKQLQDKLAFLKCEGRIDIANKIKVARSFGDISENSEYDAAREEEAQLEMEITQIENTLRNAKIIDDDQVDSSKVTVGSTVTAYDSKYKEELTFKIMGSFESDPTKGIISNESPIGKALLGHKVNDRVEINLPNGQVMKLKVLAIK